MEITIENIGERAILTKFHLTSEDIILHNEHLPHILQKDTNRKIFGRTKGEKHIKDCQYQIDVHYTDKVHNTYISVIRGADMRNRMEEPEIQQ